MKTIIATAALAGMMMTSLMVAGAQAAVSPSDLAAMHLDIVPCRSHDRAHEASDLVLADRALAAMQRRDVAALDAMMLDLRVALGHAPDVRSQPELCGDHIVLYSDDPTALLVLNGAISSNAAQGAKSVEQADGLPYGLIGFIVGWTEFEHKDYAAAAADYGRGLKNDPDLTALEAEYVLTLSSLGRNDDALQSANAYLAGHGGLPPLERANILRKRGYVLVEMKRWDEAEAAYKESLTLDPGNTMAQGDLAYIAKQRPSKP